MITSMDFSCTATRSDNNMSRRAMALANFTCFRLRLGWLRLHGLNVEIPMAAA